VVSEIENQKLEQALARARKLLIKSVLYVEVPAKTSRYFQGDFLALSSSNPVSTADDCF